MGVAVAVADRSPYRAPPRQPQNSYNAPSSPPRQPQNSYNAPSSRFDSEELFEEPKYEFDWAVNEDYNNFKQQESRDDDNTRGSYSVDLPDGRRQTVNYYVDGDSGFIAEVKYEGEAQFPDESREFSAPRPTYNAPRPTTSRPVYTTARPTTSRPRPTTRRPSYTTPRPTYNAPRPSRPSRPSNTYNAPSLLSAFGF